MLTLNKTILSCFLALLAGCSIKKPSERIIISGTQPVVIEQDYRNEDGNIRYFSKVEIYKSNEK